jgi:hypothetical protein
MAAACAALAAAVVWLAWRFDGSAGLRYLLLYVLALLPGLPLGTAVFGRRQAAGWIAGALVGYALTAVTLWALLEAGLTSRLAMTAGWSLLALATAPAWFGRRSALALPHWRVRDTRALALVLLLVPALVGPAFARIGERDAAGNRLYRSYFTADFVWHMALVAELSDLRPPPRDPYAAAEPLHYYWTYFLPPAAATAHTPHGLDHVSGVLRVNALGAGLLFIGMIFVATWIAVPTASATTFGTVMALVAASAEGASALILLLSRGQPLGDLRNINIDAVSMWYFQGLTVDGLPRALWYTPQHAGACALGLVALAVASAAGAAAPLAATLIAGVSLALAVLFSPLLGGVFAIVFGGAMAVDALRVRPVAIRGLLRQSIAALPVAAAVMASAAAGVLAGAGGVLRIGPTSGPVVALTTIALALGPLLLVSVPGVPTVVRSGPRLLPAAVAIVVGVLMFNFVSVGGTDPVWVGWRAGNLLLVVLPMLAAAAFASVSAWPISWRRFAVALGVLAFAVGLTTTVIDAYNAQDTSNRRRAPGYNWTLVVTPDQQAGYAWLRQWTARRAVVQMNPVVRGREGWSAIPSFAQRAMAGGLPISLVLQPYHRYRAREVDRLYRTTDADEAWRRARALRIDYVFVDRMDRATVPAAALEKFDTTPQHFRPMFRQGATAVYAVLH